MKNSKVPESVPGPNRLSSVSGSLGSISLRLLTLEPCSQSCFSCSVVMQSTLSSALVTTEMPSLATWTSFQETPSFLHIGTSSSSLIGREASEMSVSPAQNFSKPPPVPDVPTVILTSGYWA